MSGADDNLQRALYAKLTGNAPLMALIQGVYAAVAQPDLPESDGAFPYLVIGESIITASDTKTDDGGNALCQMDVWSRSNNLLQVKQIGAAVRTALHHQSLTISGANHIITLFESGDYSRDPDGHTKRGLLRVRVTFDQI